MSIPHTVPGINARFSRPASLATNRTNQLKSFWAEPVFSELFNTCEALDIATTLQPGTQLPQARRPLEAVLPQPHGLWKCKHEHK